MKHTLLLLGSLWLTSNLAFAATDIDAAVKDVCKCGFPPKGACMDSLVTKYPEVNKSPKLQGEIMSKAQKECSKAAAGAKGSMQDLVGNQNLDQSKLSPGTASALGGVSQSVAVTQDCSTEAFTVFIPNGWQCRKQMKNARDVTLYTDGNKLNVSVGESQGRTSCSVLPICSSESIDLSVMFATQLFKNPMSGTYEYAGKHRKSSIINVTITSNAEPSKTQLTDIKEILDSVDLR